MSPRVGPQERAFGLPANLSAALVLVRHGESTYVAEGRFQGRHDPPLSRLGERQAALVAQRLAEPRAGTPLPLPAGGPLAIWHSPLRRAAQTARAIAATQPGALEPRADDGLTELGQGAWEGLLHSEVHAGWPAELAAWRRDPLHAHAPGGESLFDAARRVGAALDRLLVELAAAQPATSQPAADRAGDLAAVNHQPVPGYPATQLATGQSQPWAVLVAHDGIFRLVLMTLLGLPYGRFWSFPFNLCSISVVSLGEGVAVLRAHNLSEHLAGLAADELAAAEARGDRRGAL